MTRDPLVTQAYQMTSADITSKEEHARRAFELAHRARRLLENAADTASRNRWPVLERSGYRPDTRIAQFAQRVANTVIKYPVHGEPKVYAALLDAIDRALIVSQMLYSDWLETQRDACQVSSYRDYVNRLGEPMAEGCVRVEPPRGEE